MLWPVSGTTRIWTQGVWILKPVVLNMTSSTTSSWRYPNRNRNINNPGRKWKWHVIIYSQHITVTNPPWNINLTVPLAFSKPTCNKTQVLYFFLAPRSLQDYGPCCLLQSPLPLGSSCACHSPPSSFKPANAQGLGTCYSALLKGTSLAFVCPVPLYIQVFSPLVFFVPWP